MHKALALLCLPLLGACSSPLEVNLHNAMPAPLIATLRVDRLGSRGESLAKLTLKPNERGTLGPVVAPPLEYIDLVITRPGDLADVPTTRRIPRGESSWTLAPDPESWSGFAIIAGLDETLSPEHD